MSSLTALWRHIVKLIEARRASFGTHWVQPENWVTRAIEQPAAASPVAKEAVSPAPSASPATTEQPSARPGQAA